MLLDYNSNWVIRQVNTRCENMYASYNKLWKLLIDKNMKKKDLMAVTGVSQATIGKLGRSETVNSNVLIRICVALHCDIGDIMEVKYDK